MENWYYKVYYDKTSTMFYKRQDALDCYKRNNGYRIETITKDLHPTIEVVIDCAGVNLERLRKDLSLKMTSEALRKAISKYDKNNTKQFNLKLNKKTDKDILDCLKQVKNKQGFIKEALRDYIKKNKNLTIDR